MNYLKSNYPWKKIELSDFSINGKLLDEPPEKINLEKGPPGKTVFKMEFRSGEYVTGTTNVKVFEEVIFSKKALKKGSCLKREDLYEKTIEITRIPTGAMNNIDSVVGKTLTRSIIANVPVMDYMLASTPILKKGHKVNLIIESPSFIITTLGELKENAYVGDTVKVVNTASKKIISGLLIDESTVKVSF
ncbi:MAG: flagellar basal body P-ring formation chaperone FlgA [Thermodesulfovibrionales bacterium]